ncbi:MAG: ATP-dependent helicase [Verrucomicrobia bacterium]|nr:ATP-dependent helicase [Verrucomicrobiota bacterium]
MARMIPELTDEQILAAHDSEAEARVYRSLRDQLSEDVTVLYSVPWIETSKSGSTDGETDFVVIDPSRGVLALEVKGGTSEVGPGGRWSTRGANGAIVPIKNPFQQGVKSKNVLRRQIHSITGVDTDSMVFGHCVALPDTYASPGNLGLDAPNEILLVEGDFESVEGKINSIFEYWSDREHRMLPTDIVDLITSRIFPRQVIGPSLGVEVRYAEERIIELTKQQCRYLGFLRNQRRVCIEGSAGTGKTVLALEKAKQLAADGVPTLLTCFNNQLAARLAFATEDLPNLTVQTFHDTCVKFAEEAGLELPADSSGFNSEFFDVKLPELMLRAIDLVPDRRFGAVVIDEAQDLQPEWWELLELLLDDDDGWLWAFRDSGQNLYGRESELPARMSAYPLQQNVRNTQKIHAAAAPFAPGDHGICIGPDGGDVRYEFATNPSAVRSVVGRALHRLINDEGLNREDVIVLTATSTANSAMSGVDRVGSFDLKAFGEEGSGIAVESVWRFKGLERPAVIVTDITEGTRDALRYVAMTRARSVLVMVGEEAGLMRT